MTALPAPAPSQYAINAQRAIARTLQRALPGQASPGGDLAQVRTRKLHPAQAAFVTSKAKRRIARAGRRGGKTIGSGAVAVRAFIAGRRVLYAAPTEDQVEAFWFEVKWALQDGLDNGSLYKNETKHIIEVPNTKNRIRAKTAWNADTLRGDYADLLILDEYQLMNEDAWAVVGAPMLLDNNGDAVFIYTPPSAHSYSVSKARDKRHASKLFKRAVADTSGRWQAFHWTSHDNPFLSAEALGEIAGDMTALAIRQEIEAIDTDEVPGALWKFEQIEKLRVTIEDTPPFKRIAIGIDPATTNTESSDETGIIAFGLGQDGHGYVIDDASLKASPHGWARAAIACYRRWQADKLVAETNNGGDMVVATIQHEDSSVYIQRVTASRGKRTRAEPIAALYEQGKIHHVGTFPELEDQMCSWLPGDDSPDRMDALVWAASDVMPIGEQQIRVIATNFWDG